MRIVIDIQVAQASPQSSRAQYTLQLAKHLAATSHSSSELILVLSGAFSGSIEPLRGEFYEVLPQTQLRVWYPPDGICSAENDDKGLRKVAEHLREAFIAEMRPDLVILPSLWIGWKDASVVGLGEAPLSPPTAVMLPSEHEVATANADGSAIQAWHQQRMDQIQQANYLLEVPGLSVTARSLGSYQDPQLLTLPASGGHDDISMAQAAERLWKVAEREQVAKKQKDAKPAKKTNPRLAYVSPLPPEQTGIGYYSAELLPELARYYEIDVIVDQSNVEDEWINANCSIRSVAWFERHGHKYERVVYHFGNSPFHAHMWELIEKIPGLAVIHDFFLGHAVAYREDAFGARLALPRELYNSHGYSGLKPLIVEGNRWDAVNFFPSSYHPIRESKGVIVHSIHARDLVNQWYGDKIANDIEIIPLLSQLPEISEQQRQTARERLGIAPDTFLICSFGVVNKTKLPHRLFRAWQNSRLRRDPVSKLVYVGGSPDEHGQRLRKEVEAYEDSDRITFTGWTDNDSFQDYLAAADVAVQLRTNSRGETSKTVLDCMAHGVATICNGHGSFAELPDQGVWKLNDFFDDQDLVEALDTLWADSTKRRVLGEQSRILIQRNHAPSYCAQRYHEVIEAAYTKSSRQRLEVIKTVVQTLPSNVLDEHLASNIGITLPDRPPQRQLLVDVSVVASEDLRTGVQRVVRSILSQLMDADLPGIRIEPVYTNPAMDGYFYAREFTQNFIGGRHVLLPDEPMEAYNGDVFLGLDLYGEGIQVQCDYLEGLRDCGVKVVFVVHDLLPVTNPQWFPEVEERNFKNWLHCITRFDGAICVSHTTADELAKWMDSCHVQRHRPYQVGVVHNGADIRQSIPSMGLPDDVEVVLAKLRNKPSFLMVGTVEPRKGVAQALNAFELLWQQGHDFNLVLVGKRGWNIDELAERLEQHEENHQRLFWLRGISDEYLERVYAASSCLIAGSEGEGFGLPLIEAAQHGIPILARDIAVFREVAGEHADYFNAAYPENLALAIVEWYQRFQQQQHASSAGMPYLTWSESAQRYLDHLLG